ncbi:MAG: carboxy terminal-processing peptidase [Deltaproteobacteria bacterium]|nr:carboxy terminal-processing peptidase [Deltaproteobacteria bacterium]
MRLNAHFFLIIILLCQAAWGSPKPTARETFLAQSISTFMEQAHISGKKLDGEISRRTFKTLVSDFDPSKLFLEKQDIEEFSKHESTLGTELSKGNVQFVYDLRDRFVQRYRQRLPLIEEWINAQHDFSIDEYMPAKPRDIHFSSDKTEIRERWRQTIKNDLLMERLAGTTLTSAQQKDKVLQQYRRELRNKEQMSSDQLLDMYLLALTTSFDPHSMYFSPGQQEQLVQTLNAAKKDLHVTLNSEGHLIVERANNIGTRPNELRAGDRIISVAADGENFEDVKGLQPERIQTLFSGTNGKPLGLRVMRPGKTVIIEYVLQKENGDPEVHGRLIKFGTKKAMVQVGWITVPSFYSEIKEPSVGSIVGGSVLDSLFAFGKHGSVFTNPAGVLLNTLPPGKDILESAFGRPPKSVSMDVWRLLRHMQKAEQIDVVVLDLRNNPGGGLQEAVRMASLFVGSEIAVQLKGGQEGTEIKRLVADRVPKALYSGPLIVLTNRMSASASEIFAAAMQDYGRGLIVGDSRTHGKGTMQRLIDLDSAANSSARLGMLKFTFAQCYRVNGHSTQGSGVRADVVLPPQVETFLADVEEEAPYSLPPSQIAPITDLKKWQDVSPEMKAALQQYSDERVKSSSEFRRVEQLLGIMKARRTETKVSLNEQRRRLEQLADDQANEWSHTSDKFDVYDQEILKVTWDYLQLKNKGMPVVKK